MSLGKDKQKRQTQICCDIEHVVAFWAHEKVKPLIPVTERQTLPWPAESPDVLSGHLHTPVRLLSPALPRVVRLLRDCPSPS